VDGPISILASATSPLMLIVEPLPRGPTVVACGPANDSASAQTAANQEKTRNGPFFVEAPICQKEARWSLFPGPIDTCALSCTEQDGWSADERHPESFSGAFPAIYHRRRSCGGPATAVDTVGEEMELNRQTQPTPIGSAARATAIKTFRARARILLSTLTNRTTSAQASAGQKGPAPTWQVGLAESLAMKSAGPGMFSTKKAPFAGVVLLTPSRCSSSGLGAGGSRPCGLSSSSSLGFRSARHRFPLSSSSTFRRWARGLRP